MNNCRVCLRPGAVRAGGLCPGCAERARKSFVHNNTLRPGNVRTVWCTGCGTVKIHPKTEYCFACKKRLAAEELARKNRPEPTAEELAKDWTDIFG